MTTFTSLKETIDIAEEIAGGLRPLARLLDTNASNLIAMRKGERPCPIGIRARLAEVTGQSTTIAMLDGLIAKLDTNDYHEAQLEVILRSVATSIQDQETKKPSSSKATGLDWRNRKFSDLLQAGMPWLLRSIHSAFYNRIGHLVQHSKRMHRVLTSGIQSHHLSFVL